MFADAGFDTVTIADVAREAGVAVQTVFNHFPTKEELFFDGRIPWAEGPAEAVRRRRPGVSPLTALREHLVEEAGHFAALQLSPEGRAFAEALHSCPALAAYEQQAVQAGERALAAVLAEAWETDPEPGGDGLASQTGLLAPLTAATWLAAARVTFSEQRRRLLVECGPVTARERVRQAVDLVLSGAQARVGRPELLRAS